MNRCKSMLIFNVFTLSLNRPGPAAALLLSCLKSVTFFEEFVYVLMTWQLTTKKARKFKLRWWAFSLGKNNLPMQLSIRQFDKMCLSEWNGAVICIENFEHVIFQSSFDFGLTFYNSKIRWNTRLCDQIQIFRK